MTDIKRANSTTPWGIMLFILFLILKVAGVITWSWVCVAAPLWIPLVLIFIIAVVVALFAAVVKILE